MSYFRKYEVFNSTGHVLQLSVGSGPGMDVPLGHLQLQGCS